MSRSMVVSGRELGRTNILEDFGEFLRLYAAERDAGALSIKD